jgi:hypothetical protein
MGEWQPFRAFDRLYYKHSRACFAGMLVLCAAILYVAWKCDSDNTAALTWATHSRGET